MSIYCNCKCNHQIYGNCELNELPEATAHIQLNKKNDCPYFESKEVYSGYIYY